MKVMCVMQLKVYLETTVISYYTADPSRDLVIAGRQESTRECWTQRGQQVEPYVSALVIQEARRGNAEFAEKRLDAIHHLNNPCTRARIRRILEQTGYHAPEMCSPEELTGEMP